MSDSLSRNSCQKYIVYFFEALLLPSSLTVVYSVILYSVSPQWTENSLHWPLLSVHQGQKIAPVCYFCPSLWTENNTELV